MEGWQIRLHGADEEIVGLSDYVDSTGWVPKQIGEFWFLEDTEGKFTPDQGQEAHLNAGAVLQRALVVALLLGRKFPEVVLGAPSILNDNGTRLHAMWSDTSIAVETGLVGHMNGETGEEIVSFQLTGRSHEETLLDHEPPGQLTKLLCEHPETAEAVSLFARFPENWAQMTKILELIRIDLGGDIPAAWASKTKTGLLERTAQFAISAGETSRHITANGLPPPKPMTLAQANLLIRQVLVEWVKSKSCTP